MPVESQSSFGCAERRRQFILIIGRPRLYSFYYATVASPLVIIWFVFVELILTLFVVQLATEGALQNALSSRGESLLAFYPLPSSPPHYLLQPPVRHSCR